MRLRFIALHYAKGWLWIDASLASVDLVSYLSLDDAMEVLTLLRLVRNLRVLRLFKMMSRLAVLRETMMSIDSRLESGPTSSIFLETSLVVVKQLGVIALLCHFTGCAWYTLGSAMSGTTWVVAHADWRAMDLGVDAPWEYMYITAVHWALTQFTPAAMDVVAVNPLERVFSVVVTLAGLIVFSFFLGTINQALAKLRYLTAQEIQQNQLVRRYVNENGISVGLATEILAFIKQRGLGKAQSKLVAGDIKVLEALPRRVRENLLEEVAMPVLESHPLFEFLSKIAHPEMARQCHKAIKEKSVIHGEEVFQPNSSADRMFFVQSGRLKYQPDISPLDSEDVLEGTRVAEATLWLKWEYRGRLNCEDHSAHFMALDAPFFRKAMARSSLCDSVTMYARLFLQALIETYPEEDEASDLFGRDDQLKSLVKTVKGVQDGAAKFSALGVQRGPDFVEAFDAWKEVWMQSRNRKVREKSCLGRFWKLFYQQTEGRSSNREVQRTVEVADVSEIEPIEPSGLSGLSDSESVE